MTTVAVFTPDDKEIIGVGEMHIEDVKVTDDDDDTIVLYVLKDHPVIIMEDGEILCGIECWWMPLADFVTMNHIMLYKQEVKNV